MANVAIIGATGAVGRQLLEVLEEREFSVKELRLFASERSVGEFIDFNDTSYPVQQLDDDSFDGVDVAMFCAPESVSVEYCPRAAAIGVKCIDTSSAWRMDADVPLVVPEVNGDALELLKNKRIVASPSSLALMMVLPLKVLHGCSPLQRVVVSTYQSVSGHGLKAVDELRVQSGELLNGRPAKQSMFPHQIGFNCLPQIGPAADQDYTAEEIAAGNELRKILGLEKLGVSVTAVQVPVFYGDSVSMNIQLADAVAVDHIREALASSAGMELIDDLSAHDYPLPVDAAGQDEIFVGRIRQDLSCPEAVNLWACADNLRNGAAINVVQIAELIVAQ